MSDSFLSQEEIDALLQKKDTPQNGEQKDEQGKEEEAEGAREQAQQEEQAGAEQEPEPELTNTEKDALGEIGNISMGSASTTLSQILSQKVTITTPRVWISSQAELLSSFEKPYVIVDVNFTEGLEGSNLLVIKIQDATIIADLMMGGDGSNPAEELSDMHLSAVGEAMNQMIGSAATSMSTIFQRAVSITPPQAYMRDFQEDNSELLSSESEKLVIVSFDLQIGDLINSEIMQIMPFEVAQEAANMLLNPSAPAEEKEAETQEQIERAAEDEEPEEPKTEQQAPPEEEASQAAAQKETAASTAPSKEKAFSGGGDKSEAASFTPGQSKNLDLILDVPLRVSVVLGKTQKPIDEVLQLGPGSVVELNKLANEPVDILVNGKLIAHGEVVVVEENFGVRITSIVSPRERINNLKEH